MDLKTLKETPPWEWPRGADEFFFDILRDEQRSLDDRCAAAMMAGECSVINEDLGEALLRILLSEKQPEELRATAAIAFGPTFEDTFALQFDDSEETVLSETLYHNVRRALERLFRNEAAPKLLRRRALEASVRAPEPWHGEAVIEAYNSDDQEWRLTALFCMQYVQGFEDCILDSLTSKDEDIHYAAVCAAGESSIGAAWPHLVSIIKRHDEVDRSLLLAAIEAVSNIRPKAAIEVLEPLSRSEDEEIAEAALDAMSMAGALEDDDYYNDDDF